MSVHHFCHHCSCVLPDCDSRERLVAAGNTCLRVATVGNEQRAPMFHPSRSSSTQQRWPIHPLLPQEKNYSSRSESTPLVTRGVRGQSNVNENDLSVSIVEPSIGGTAPLPANSFPALSIIGLRQSVVYFQVGPFSHVPPAIDHNWPADSARVGVR